MEPSSSRAPRPDHVPLADLAGLGITSHRGAGWARAEVLTSLLDTGCPAPPDGPAADLILNVAAARLAAAFDHALPEHLTLIDDTVWGPDGTDLDELARQAMSWRDQVGVADIVARTGLWAPPPIALMPTVRIEARLDVITPDGHFLGELATRAHAHYWAVYGVLPNGQVDLAADFATEAAARRYATRWQRPGVLVTADAVEPLQPATPSDNSAALRSPHRAGPAHQSARALTRSPALRAHR
jgi:hypothetical protein